jgi:hypothetical protein
VRCFAPTHFRSNVYFHRRYDLRKSGATSPRMESLFECLYLTSACLYPWAVSIPSHSSRRRTIRSCSLQMPMSLEVLASSKSYRRHRFDVAPCTIPNQYQRRPRPREA